MEQFGNPGVTTAHLPKRHNGAREGAASRRYHVYYWLCGRQKPRCRAIVSPDRVPPGWIGQVSGVQDHLSSIDTQTRRGQIGSLHHHSAMHPGDAPDNQHQSDPIATEGTCHPAKPRGAVSNLIPHAISS